MEMWIFQAVLCFITLMGVIHRASGAVRCYACMDHTDIGGFNLGDWLQPWKQDLHDEGYTNIDHKVSQCGLDAFSNGHKLDNGTYETYAAGNSKAYCMSQNGYCLTLISDETNYDLINVGKTYQFYTLMRGCDSKDLCATHKNVPWERTETVPGRPEHKRHTTVSCFYGELSNEAEVMKKKASVIVLSIFCVLSFLLKSV